jgi:hypothetical protein
MDDAVPRWVRWIAGAALGVPQLAIGLWALFAARSWFDDFPGIGPALVAAEPPFNRHLATDVGAAFVATGIALVLAAVVFATRDAMRLALVTYLAFAVPHTVYHATHEAAGLSTAADAFNVFLLSSGALVAVVLLFATSRRGLRRAAHAV